MKVSNKGLMCGKADAFEKGDVSGFSKFLADDVTYLCPARTRSLEITTVLKLFSLSGSGKDSF